MSACKHGNLARSCEVCNLESALAAAQARVALLEGMLTATQQRVVELNRICKFAEDAASAALRSEAQVVPEGMMLVPVEPTEEMQQAWQRGIWSNPSNPDESLATSVRAMFVHAWKAALAAAPGAPK